MTIGDTILVLFGLCALLAYLPLLLWRAYFKRHSGPTILMYSVVAFGLMAGLGFAGLLIGFLGPLAFSDSGIGPMLSVATVPLGVVIGMLSAWVWFYIRRNEP